MQSIKKIRSALLVALALMPVSQVAQAVPSAFSNNCGALNIKNPTNSTLLRDNKQCGIVYVLPPHAGTTNFKGYEPLGPLGMCSTLKKTMKRASLGQDYREDLTREMLSLTPKFEAAKAKVEKAKKTLRDATSNAVFRQIQDLADEIVDIEAQIERVLTDMNECEQNCDELRREYRELRQARRTLRADLRNLRSEHRDIVRIADRAKREFESAEFALKNVMLAYREKKDALDQERDDIYKEMMLVSRFHAANANIDYNTGWDENVKLLNEKYGNSFEFRPISTKDVRINAAFIGIEDKELFLASMPSMLGYVINNKKMIPWGEEQVLEQDALGSHLSGKINLTLMGACPAYYKNFLSSEDLIESDAKESTDYSITITYKYPAAFKMRMSAYYNLYKFYEKIVTSSSSGGFFRKKHHKTVVENKIDRDTFHIKWDVEDPDSHYSPEERRKIENSLKTELMGRVLNTMASPVFTNQPNVDANVPVVSTTGALVLAQGLEKTCGYYSIYCTGGAWLLRGLDAIFGSSSAAATYRATHDRTAKEIWDVNETRWRMGSTGFYTKD